MFVVYTKPNQEDRADVNLRRQGYETFFPKCRERTRIMPLFPRYLFLNVPPHMPIGPVYNTYGVTNILIGMNGEAEHINAAVLEEIIARTENGIVELAGPAERAFSPGQEVRVIGGAHIGIDGLFVKKAGERVTVLLQMFGGHVKATVNEKHVI